MLLLPALLLTAAPLVAAEAARTPAALARTWSDAAGFHRHGVETAGIVGSSLLLVHDGQVVGRSVAGLADKDTGRAVDDDTIFHWASITKTMTGIAVMQLRDRGRLQLDDPIVKYVPELRQVHNPYGDPSQITIRHLLSHSAGLRGPTWPWGGDEPWHPFEPPRWEQVAAMLLYTNVLFEPGRQYSYSNPGIVFLGRMIETLTNEDYEVYVDKNVLRPLGMHPAFFDRAPYHLLRFRSHSYFRSDAGLREAPFDFDTGATVSNGGLNAPLGEMASYLSFLIGDPKRQAEYDGILKRSSLEEMWKGVVRVEDSGDASVSMGLCFFLETRGSQDYVAHSGNQNGFLSHFFLHVPTRTAYIVAFNTDVAQKDAPDGSATRVFDFELRDYLLAKVFPVFR